MKEFWNERFGHNEYAYGTEPNEFFKQSVDSYKPKGKILMPAEGEGRNAVYAAKTGLEVFAFDTSEQGQKKALQLAKKENVKITYEICTFPNLTLMDDTFDVLGLVFAHFPPDIRESFHNILGSMVKPNGLVILEGFSKENLKLREANPNIGGPRSLDMLFSTEQIQNDFSEFDILKLEQTLTELNEGKFHKGIASVIRFIGKRKS